MRLRTSDRLARRPVEDLDDTVGEIRTSIFDLHTAGEGRKAGCGATSWTRPRRPPRVTGCPAGDELLVEVVDDGSGMDPGVARSGLRNLEERARECGGSLRVGAGTGVAPE